MILKGLELQMYHQRSRVHMLCIRTCSTWPSLLVFKMRKNASVGTGHTIFFTVLRLTAKCQCPRNTILDKSNIQKYRQVEKPPEKSLSAPFLEGAEYLCWRLWE